MSSTDDPDLYWDATYAIALALIKYHGEADPAGVGLVELSSLVQKLPNFRDDPALVNDRLLQDIQIEWYEESIRR